MVCGKCDENLKLGAIELFKREVPIPYSQVSSDINRTVFSVLPLFLSFLVLPYEPMGKQFPLGSSSLKSVIQTLNRWIKLQPTDRFHMLRASFSLFSRAQGGSKLIVAV